MFRPTHPGLEFVFLFGEGGLKERAFFSVSLSHFNFCFVSQCSCYGFSALWPWRRGQLPPHWPPPPLRHSPHIQSTCLSMHMRGQTCMWHHTHDTQCGWDGVKPASAQESPLVWRGGRGRGEERRWGDRGGGERWDGGGEAAGRYEGEEAIFS